MPQYGYETLIGLAYAHISTATTTIIKPAAGVLSAIIVNTPLAGTITIYDSATASGTVVAVITVTSTLPATGVPIAYGINLVNGLTIVTSAAMDLTVVYR